MSTAITPPPGDFDWFAQLRRPFTVDAVLFKVQAGTGDQALASWYVDARLVAERLTAVVGGEMWHDDYRPLFEDNAQAHMGFHFPVECRLTVNGITRVDVGNYQKTDADEKAIKSAYSDAFKRAAVKFGIGAYLYALPKTYAETKKNPKTGKVSGFSNAGVRQLRAAYSAWLASNQPFGDALDHGFAVANHDDDPEDSPAAPGTTGAAASASDSAPAAGEHHHQGQTTSEAITTAYRNLEKEVGEDNARAAYALALHAAGVQPGDTPTYEQAQMIIGNLELALPAKVTA